VCHGRRNLERFEGCSDCFREGIPYVEGDQKDIINTATRKADGVDTETERGQQMTGKGKVVKCCGTTENAAELTEHPAAAERVGSTGTRQNNQANPCKT